MSAGVSLPIIGELLGHTQAATTQRYAHVDDAAQRQATDHMESMMGAMLPAPAASNGG